MDEDAALGEFEVLVGALETLARQFSAFDELEFAASINDAMDEVDLEEPGGWPSLVALLGVWPVELFGQLLDAVERDPDLQGALLVLDDEDAIDTLSALGADPVDLVTRFQAATSLPAATP